MTPGLHGCRADSWVNLELHYHHPHLTQDLIQVAREGAGGRRCWPVSASSVHCPFACAVLGPSSWQVSGAQLRGT